MFNEFDAGDDYNEGQEMYENDLELRGNNEAWEDAQAEMAEYPDEDEDEVETPEDPFGNYAELEEDEYDDDSMYGSEFNEPGDYGYDDQY